MITSLIKKIMKRDVLIGFLVFLLYLSLSIFYMGFYKHNVFSSMFSPGGDQSYFLFFLKWWPWTITHNVNPFKTNYLTYPRFYNTAWLTSVPILSLIASPITYYFGVIFSWNILMLLAPITAAFSAYLLFRYLKLNYFASFAGGYIFGFSTYEMAEFITGHIHMVYIFPVPVIILLLLKRFSKQISRKSFIISTAFLMVFLFGITTEIMTTFVVFLFLSAIVFILYNLKNKKILSRIYRLSFETFFAGLTAIVISFPFVYYLVKGLKNGINKPILFSAKWNSADLLNFIIPANFTKIGGDFCSRFFHFWKGNDYIGIGLLIIIIFSMRNLLKKEKEEIGGDSQFIWVKPLIFITFMILIFSLGPYLHIDGIITMMPMPGHLFIFPPLNNAAPNRFIMYVFLLIGFWFAVWVGNIKENTLKSEKYKIYGRYALLVLSLLLIVPNYTAYVWGNPNFNRKAIKKFVPKESDILPIPFSPSPYEQGALWVAGSNFKIHMTGPNWGFQVYKHNGRVYKMLNDNKISGNFKRLITGYCLKHGIKYILISEKAHKKTMWESAFNKMGWKSKIGYGIIIYKVILR